MRGAREVEFGDLSGREHARGGVDGVDDAAVAGVDGQAHAAREGVVADEDRHLVAPALRSRGFAATEVGLVDDVVVGEGSQVQEFDRGRRMERDAFVGALAELGDEQEQGGSHPFALLAEEAAKPPGEFAGSAVGLVFEKLPGSVESLPDLQTRRLERARSRNRGRSDRIAGRVR